MTGDVTIMKSIERLMNLTRVAVLATAATSPRPTAVAAPPVDACNVLTVEEIKAALGRLDLGTARPGKASGGHSDCRFPGSGSGDVRVMLSPEMASAKDDFALQPEILAAEGKSFEEVGGIGDGAYYWNDSVQFRVDDRIVSLWIVRTSRTEPPAAVKAALTSLAARAAQRLSAVR
jgi:hypothetical protein